jgi:hypothetical protein
VNKHKVADPSTPSLDRPSPGRSVDRIIGTSLLVVAALEGGLNALLLQAIGQLGVWKPDRVEFVRLFLGTFALSLTVAVALAVYVVPRVYGRDWGWQLPVIVFVVGAALAGLPISHPHGGGAFNYMIDSTRAFMVHYGPAFYTGVAVGVASGIIIGVLALHYRESEAIARSDQRTYERTKAAARKASTDPGTIRRLEWEVLFRDSRAPRAWRFETGLLVAGLLVLTIVAQQGLARSGAAWHRETSGTTQNLTGVAWSGTRYVAVGRGGTMITSTDGRRWVSETSFTAYDLWDVEWTGGQFVAVGDAGTVLTSPTGEWWTSRNSGTGGYINSVVWSGTQFVAVGHRGLILTSLDGVGWSRQTAVTSADLSSVIWSGRQFVTVGRSGATDTSVDGRQWTAASISVQDLTSVAWSGTQFVAVGNAGTIRTSPDGINWTTRSSETTGHLGAVIWTGTEFLAVGDVILSSPTGTTWTRQTSSKAYLTDVIRAGRRYVAVGNSGTVLTSS